MGVFSDTPVFFCCQRTADAEDKTKTAEPPLSYIKKADITKEEITRNAYI